MRSTNLAYTREFTAAMLAYAVVLGASTLVVQANPGAWWRYVVALAPMVPATFIVVAYLRHLRRMDELQRRVQLEGLAFAFAGTALVTFGYGFLEDVGLPHLSWFFVWPLMATLWVLGLAIAARRYR